MSNIIEIEYNSQLPEVTREGLTLVDFYATWCGPCKMLAPVLSELAIQYEGKVQFAKLDVDELPVLAQEYQVMTVPTLMLFKDGIAIESAKGFYPETELKKWLDYHTK